MLSWGCFTASGLPANVYIDFFSPYVGLAFIFINTSSCRGFPFKGPQRALYIFHRRIYFAHWWNATTSVVASTTITHQIKWGKHNTTSARWKSRCSKGRDFNLSRIQREISFRDFWQCGRGYCMTIPIQELRIFLHLAWKTVLAATCRPRAYSVVNHQPLALIYGSLKSESLFWLIYMGFQCSLQWEQVMVTTTLRWVGVMDPTC